MKPLLVAWDFNGVINRFEVAMEPVLRRVQAHGAEQIVVSSSWPGTIEEFLQKNGLSEFFMEVYGFTPDSLQWVGDRSVMKKNTLTRHIHKFGPYQRMVVIGDSESDIRAGKSLGAQACLVVEGTPGFETSADTVAHGVEEVEKFILEKQGEA